MNNSQPTETFSVAVIGGGIGGLCLTIALLRRGIPVKVYEQAPEFKEIGLGIGLGPNSIAAMQLIDPAIAQSFKKLATDNASVNIEEHFRTWINFRDGRTNQPRLVAKVMTCDINRTGICSARRAPFLDQLIAMIPKEICFFGKRLINMERLQNGTTILVFEDGSSAEADVIIGCDGIKSATRHLLFSGRSLDDFLTFTNDVAYRALLPMREAEQAVGHDLAHNAQLYLFPGGHILTYPVDGHAAVNVIGVVRKESWEHESWLLKDVQSEQVDSDFQAAGIHIKKLIKAMNEQEVSKWALWDSVPLTTYCRGNIALLGDAAHASLPHQGAGAGQAIEDALVLSEVLAVARTKENVALALKAYDVIRRPRSQAVVKTSREAGYLYKLFGSEGSDMSRIRDNLLTRMNWIWYESMELQIKRAVEVLEILVQRK